MTLRPPESAGLLIVPAGREPVTIYHNGSRCALILISHTGVGRFLRVARGHETLS
jgi:hypothetical protein